MKVIKNNNIKTFNDLEAGTVFRCIDPYSAYSDVYCLKCLSNEDKDTFAVILTSGEKVIFADEYEVITYPDARVIIDREEK